MTRKEAIRQTEQADQLMALGFTAEEAEQLRRISMTLHRWHELECGTDSAAIVRGSWNKQTQTFDYDEDGTGAPHFEYANGSGRSRYARIPDRETGAKKRLQAIIDARNVRHAPYTDVVNGAAVKIDGPKSSSNRVDNRLRAYIQTDPRGAALYIIRPGDVPDGANVDSYYDRGICVY